MSTVLSEMDVALQWLDITVERFLANIQRLKIKNTGHLAESFRKEVIGAAGGDQLKLRISYALYGQFVDMGVGRGMGKGIRKGADGYDAIRNSRGQLKRKTRRPKKWRTPQLMYETHRLSEVMSARYGQVMLALVRDVLPPRVEITF
jgi:hypothetical protein